MTWAAAEVVQGSGLTSVISRAFHTTVLRFAGLGGGAPVLILQMGKVGSRTVVESLRTSRIGRPVYHVHRLSDRGLDWKRRRRTPERPRPGRNYWASLYLRRRIESAAPGTRWDVVTLVRDPIARNVSAFFHAIDRWYPEFRREGVGDVGAREVERLAGVFLERYPHSFPGDWFRDELETFFGVDVFARGFPTSAGYAVYRDLGSLNLLILRTEDLDQCLESAMAAWLKAVPIPVRRANEGTKRTDGRIYRTFLSRVRFPSRYVEQMYTSRYAQHFYTNRELEAFRRRWQGV